MTHQTHNKSNVLHVRSATVHKLNFFITDKAEAKVPMIQSNDTPNQPQDVM